MRELLDEIKRFKGLINASVDRLETMQDLELRTVDDIPNYKVFMKRESSVLLKLSFSMLWKSLSLWCKIRL